MLSPYPNVDYLSNESKFKFRDYNITGAFRNGAMGELQRESRPQQDSYNRHTDNASPVSRETRMDSPSSESMDSIVESCHVNNRKRRRGVIEKRRRDRINNSLAELRRLVPSAFEKQGSTKLEKAEILQLTVDHLKSIHTKGLNCDPNAIDSQLLGYQECMAEVGRFLMQCPEIPNPDPLRSRLLSHLQCAQAQRESMKQQTMWHQSSYPTGPTGLVPPPPPPGISATASLFSPQTESHTTNMGVSISLQTPSCLGTSGISYAAASTSTFTAPSFSPSFNQYPSFTGSTAMHYMNSASSQSGYPSARTHRPWGSELVYGM